jgi:hypothetical protein
VWYHVTLKRDKFDDSKHYRYKVCNKQRDSVVFLRKIAGSKECISYKGLTKYSTNLVNTGVLEGAITEWE